MFYDLALPSVSTSLTLYSIWYEPMSISGQGEMLMCEQSVSIPATFQGMNNPPVVAIEKLMMPCVVFNQTLVEFSHHVNQRGQGREPRDDGKFLSSMRGDLEVEEVVAEEILLYGA
jgi:hypothetical protein